MGRKCFITNCKSGYNSNPEKVNIFLTPRDEATLKLWREVIPRKDRVLGLKDAVCAKHFREEDIRKEWKSGGNCIPLKVVRLKKDAIPSIFKDNTPYISNAKRERLLCSTKEKNLKVPTKSNKPGPLEYIPVDIKIPDDSEPNLILFKHVPDPLDTIVLDEMVSDTPIEIVKHEVSPIVLNKVVPNKKPESTIVSNTLVPDTTEVLSAPYKIILNSVNLLDKMVSITMAPIKIESSTSEIIDINARMPNKMVLDTGADKITNNIVGGTVPDIDKMVVDPIVPASEAMSVKDITNEIVLNTVVPYKMVLDNEIVGDTVLDKRVPDTMDTVVPDSEAMLVKYNEIVLNTIVPDIIVGDTMPDKCVPDKMIIDTIVPDSEVIPVTDISNEIILNTIVPNTDTIVPASKAMPVKVISNEIVLDKMIPNTITQLKHKVVPSTIAPNTNEVVSHTNTRIPDKLVPDTILPDVKATDIIKPMKDIDNKILIAQSKMVPAHTDTPKQVVLEIVPRHTPVNILPKENKLLNLGVLTKIGADTIIERNHLVPITIVPVQPLSAVFEIIYKSEIKIPDNWCHSKINMDNEKFVSFTKYVKSQNGVPMSQKQIIIDSSLRLKVLILQKLCTNRDIFPGVVNSIADIENILLLFDNLYLCQGGPNILFTVSNMNSNKCYKDDYFKVWRHSQCTILSESLGSCKFCDNLQQTYPNENSKTLQSQQKINKSMIKLRRIRANQRKKLKRLLKKVNLLKTKLTDFRKNIAFKTENTIIENKIQEMGVSKIQQLFIMQCLEHAKHATKKTVKYSQDWIRICMLLHSKYPKSYIFLRNNDIMPLPCMRSIRRYLSLSKTNSEYVIDEQALEALGITL